jgi:hypothetical protein
VATDLKAAYRAAAPEEAERQLAEFQEAWAGSYPVMALELVESRPDVLLPFGDQAGHLHDEHGRVSEHDAAEGDEEPVRPRLYA